MTLGILTLAYMREQLNKNNLKNTYPKGTLTGFQNPGQEPPTGATHFRSADGSWNKRDMDIIRLLLPHVKAQNRITELPGWSVETRG